MLAATLANPAISFRDIADTIAPNGRRFDPLGLVSGYKSYLVYSALAAKSDTDLAAMGLARADVPRVALEAIR